MSAPLVRPQQDGTTTTLLVEGLMILTEDAKHLREQVERSLAGGATKVVIDLTHCMYISELCALAFGQCHTLVKARGGRCSLTNLDERHGPYLQATGVLDQFGRMN